MKDIRVVLLIATALAAVGCHNEEDCGGQVLPAGVELEMTLTSTVSDEGCDGLGASLGDVVRYVTDEPVDVGAHNKCLSETLEPPGAGELYGLSVDFCVRRRGGFICEGSLLACPSQSARLDVATSFGDLPATGSESRGVYAVEVSADAQGACAAVRCRQQFDATTKRL